MEVTEARQRYHRFMEAASRMIWEDYCRKLVDGRTCRTQLQWSGLGLCSIDRKLGADHVTLAPNHFARFANK
jgi:hypothetical protein